MIKWFSTTEHIYFIIMTLIVVILAEAIVIFKMSSKNKKRDVESTIEFFRKFWGGFVIYVLATSVIGMFLASIIKGDSITVEIINNWVSIVLGLVALVVGIISLWISFYSVNQMNQAKEEVEETAKNIREKRIGWQVDDRGEWYYINSNGKMAINEWKRSGDNQYRLGKDGYLERNKLIYEDNKRYYVDENGMMKKETFIEIDGKQMYAQVNGTIFEKGTIEIDGKIYTFENGFLVSDK